MLYTRTINNQTGLRRPMSSRYSNDRHQLENQYGYETIGPMDLQEHILCNP